MVRPTLLVSFLDSDASLPGRAFCRLFIGLVFDPVLLEVDVIEVLLQSTG